MRLDTTAVALLEVDEKMPHGDYLQGTELFYFFNLYPVCANPVFGA